MKNTTTRINKRVPAGIQPDSGSRLCLEKSCFFIIIILLSINTAIAGNNYSLGWGTPILGMPAQPQSLNMCPAPATPTAIYGPTNACPFMGQPTNAVYSIDPVATATSYTWTVPSNAVLVSGQGTKSIVVSYLSGFSSGSIKVTANSSCGSRAPRSLSIRKLVPSTPSAITGETNACAHIGSSTPVSYSIQPVANATSYTWTIPANVTIVSGQGTTNLTVTFNSGYITSLFKVRSVAACGESSDRSLSVVAKKPGQPGLITGSINVCPYMVSATNPTGIPVTYSIRKVSSATSYAWTPPVNGSIIEHPGGPGVNDTIIKVIYSAAFVSGSINVAVVNGCGTGTARTLVISKLSAGTPGNIDIIQTGYCPNRQYTYTIASMPWNATGILWTVPANATLVSGNGTTSITVAYSSSSVLGTITARPYNNCSNGSMKSLEVKLPGCPPPSDENKISKTVQPRLVVEDAIQVKIFSNPTVSNFKAQLLTAGKEMIRISIRDMSGNELKNFVSKPNEIIFFGSEFKPGTYVMEVRQGLNKISKTLLKL